MKPNSVEKYTDQTIEPDTYVLPTSVIRDATCAPPVRVVRVSGTRLYVARDAETLEDSWTGMQSTKTVEFVASSLEAARQFFSRTQAYDRAARQLVEEQKREAARNKLDFVNRLLGENGREP